MGNDPDTLKQMRVMGMYLMLPALLLAAPVIGYLIGDQIAKRWQVGDWVKVVMALVGMAAGGREVYRIVKKASRLQ